MDTEFADRQQAIKLRLAGHPIADICQLLGHPVTWFHLWWRRYRALGPTGLFDLTRANAQPRRIAPDLERTIITIRQRLASQAHPGTRYSLIGASTILAELHALHIRPLPSLRTIERVLQRNGVSVPKVRLAPFIANPTYPVPSNGQVEHFNGWFQPRLFQRHYTQVATLRRELHRLQETVNIQHPQRRLQGLTPAQYRRRCKLQKLPQAYVMPTDLLPIAAGRISFIRQVTLNGKVHVLSQTFKVGKRLKGEYVKVVLDTRRRHLTIYRQGRVFKRWPYPFLKK